MPLKPTPLRSAVYGRSPAGIAIVSATEYQYTDPEWYFIEQAYANGQNAWPYAATVTHEYNLIVRNHASAAYMTGKDGKTLEQKGGAGYSRNAPINEDCPQCAGQGEPMLYFCDTQKLSPGGRRIFKGVRLKTVATSRS